MLQRGKLVRCGHQQQRGVVQAVRLRTHMRDTYPLLAQPQQLRCRPCPRAVQCRVFDKFKDMLGGKKQQQASSSSSSVSWEDPEDQNMQEEEEGAEMVPLDLDSRGGLGGTSENVLGPLVRSLLASSLPHMPTLVLAVSQATGAQQHHAISSVHCASHIPAPLHEVQKARCRTQLLHGDPLSAICAALPCRRRCCWWGTVQRSLSSSGP
jgi:hypothetical protein